MKLKRILTLTLALMLLVSCMGITAFADSAPWAEGTTPANTQIFYTATEKVEPNEQYCFTYNSGSSSYEPATQKGIMVFTSSITKIDTYWLININTLKSVILPKSVTSICDQAFENCSALTSVSLPEATSIGDKAFEYCSALTSVSLPKATSIGEKAFENCFKLTSVSLPEATSIGDHAFENCTDLTSVSLPKATSIGEGAFVNCSKLKYVYAPAAASNIMADNSLYTVTTSAAENGTVTLNDDVEFEEVTGCVTYYVSEKYYTVTATPDAGYMLDSLTATYNEGEEKSLTISNGSFAMPAAATTVTATFAPKACAITNDAPIADKDTNNGYITVSETSAAENAEITVTAYPADGYKLDSLTYTPTSGGSAKDITNGTFTMPAYAVTVSATFSKIVTTGENINLDLEASTESIPVSTTIDQYYTKTEASSTVYKNKIKVVWTNTTMNIKVTNAKVWNPTTLSWDTDNTKNGIATVDGETNKTTFTLTNYSAKAFTCNLSFALDKSQSAKFTKCEMNGTDVNLAAVANNINQPDVTLATSTPTTATITATITPTLTGDGSFAGAAATTSAVKYGTFTISCTAVNN